MNIARILYPVQVLGPGKRIGIWLCGCPRRCPGCSNPELWTFRPEYEIDVQTAISMIWDSFADFPVDGITISGGDPFYQPKALKELLAALYGLSPDILVYTGYDYEELKTSANPDILAALSFTGVLIDGQYIEEKNDGALLRGSSNQHIIVFDPALEEKYRAYLKEQKENQIQNFTTKDGVISVGIHKPDFNAAIREKARERGVITDGRE